MKFRLPRRNAIRGTTVLELLLGMGLFTLMMVVLVGLFNQSLLIWRTTSGSDTAMRELRRVVAALDRDLALASPAMLSRTQVVDHLGGGGRDGEALWFLSPLDPATGQLARKPDGSPMWMRNVLYYLVVPANHDTVFSMSCPGGAGPNGYDDRCPHKLLIRKVIDSGPPTLAADEASQEELLVDVSAYLTQPDGFDLGAMAEPGLEDKRVIANNLLMFQTLSAPPPVGAPREVAVDVRAMSVEEARREIRVGLEAGASSRFTLQLPFSVLLQN
ncbi:hypothetical protein DYH09_10805 [bacterium CPR1]|nr:hypothetical protein [bacterium CPR1]